MKKGIHPKLHEVVVKMTNGKTFKTFSTYGKAGDTIILDIDPHNHPAWTGLDRGAMENISSVMKYRKKFGSLNLLDNTQNAQNSNKKEESTDNKD